MKLVIYLIWFAIVSVIPLSATIVAFFYFRKSLKYFSVMGILFSFGLVVRDILLYMPQQSFFERLIAYFNAKHLCISFYGIYLPIGVLFILYPLIFYGTEKLKK